MAFASEVKKTTGILNIFQWNIANFKSLVHLAKEDITSPVFVGKSLELPNSFWQIIVFKQMVAVGGAKENYLGVYLKLNKNLNQHNPVIKIKFQLFLMKGGQEISLTSISVIECNANAESAKGVTKLSYSKLFGKKSGFFFDNNIFRLQIKFWILHEEINKTVVPIGPFTKEQLLKDFSQLLESPEFSDVDIVTGDSTLKAHKVILSCRSQVFSAMFQVNMSETLTNTVTIQEFSGHTVKGMLQFIYGRSVEGVNEDCKELLKIADKYQLEELKSICANIALLKISPENVIEMLIIGDMHNVPELKSKAMNFINSNKGNVIFSMENANEPKLEKLAEEHPKLMVEMYKNIRNNSALFVPYSAESNTTIHEMTMFTTNRK